MPSSKQSPLVLPVAGKVKSRGSGTRIEHAALCRMDKVANEGIKMQKEYKGKDVIKRDGRELTLVMKILNVIGAWGEMLFILSLCRVKDSQQKFFILILWEPN